MAVCASCFPAPQAASAPNATNVAGPATSSVAPGAAAASGSTTAAVSSDGSYQTFKGDGSTGAGWPAKSAWKSFDDAFSANQATMLSSDSQAEVDAIKSSIKTVSASTGVPDVFILAVIMQESHGDVRVGSTAVAVTNPGLMQSHDGVDCVGQTPCPDATITQMILDGTGGTASGAGLKQGLTGPAAIDVYKAARTYNTGSLDPSGDLAINGCTPCYSSDIANRLIGFVGDSPCKSADVGADDSGCT